MVVLGFTGFYVLVGSGPNGNGSIALCLYLVFLKGGARIRGCFISVSYKHLIRVKNLWDGRWTGSCFRPPIALLPCPLSQSWSPEPKKWKVREISKVFFLFKPSPFEPCDRCPSMKWHSWQRQPGSKLNVLGSVACMLENFSPCHKAS